MHRYLHTALTLIIVSGLSTACTSSQTAGGSATGMVAEHERIAFGGRLFDMWYDEIDATFVPDNHETPAIDGRGGPNGNGTLNGLDGKPSANSGHDYRLKNLFGWAMRGNAGIYGQDYQAKPWILAAGPLSPEFASRSRAQWITRMHNGDASGIPAFGEILSALEIESLVDYMLAVRDGELPRPDDLYRLATDAPKGFIIAPGGDAERGRQFYTDQCADCHGKDGTKIIFDNGEQSLGQHARYYGYAVAMIAWSGEPGSEMGPQLSAGMSAGEQTSTLLDLLAALCDRERFGPGAATDPDVPDADLRCGDYLR